MWMGDFNYRISLPGDEVKKAIQAQLFAQLAPNDQLTQQKAIGLVCFFFFFLFNYVVQTVTYICQSL